MAVGGREVPVADIDGVTRPTLSGDHPDNMVNRTFSKGGAQLELTTPRNREPTGAGGRKRTFASIDQ